MKYRVLLIAIGVLNMVAHTACQTTPAAETAIAKPAYQPLTDDVAAKYYLAAAMSSSAYAQKERQFDLGQLGWRKIGWPDGKSIEQDQHSYTAFHFFGFGSGLAFDIWEKESTSEVIFAFRGTDKKDDWLKANLATGFSVAYKSAKKKVREFIAAHPDKKVILFTGHSLGGGLSLSCSCAEGIDAVVFDSSPRVFDGLGDVQKPAQRISIHEKDEVLERVRRHYPKFHEVISAMYESDDVFPPDVSKHSGYHLALNIIKKAAKTDPSAAALLKGHP